MVGGNNAKFAASVLFPGEERPQVVKESAKSGL